MIRDRGLRDLFSAVGRRARWAVRDRFPNRKVVRDVQGVTLVLPWSHRLPDYAPPGSIYGQNLVALAALLGASETDPLTVLDVGANVGDSAVQILDATDARVLCVEADSAYLEFLHLNVDKDPRVTVVEALLSTDDAAAPMAAVRRGGTTRFVEATPDAADAAAVVRATELRAQFPTFDRLRLVKSDTDGYDVALIPAIVDAWQDVRPVLFFEYDPALSRIAGHDAAAVWTHLARHGYDSVAVWDNGGQPLGLTTVDAVAEQSTVLEAPHIRPAKYYWDVAVAHRDDKAGRQALEQLVPFDLDVSEG